MNSVSFSEHRSSIEDQRLEFSVNDPANRAENKLKMNGSGRSQMDFHPLSDASMGFEFSVELGT